MKIILLFIFSIYSTLIVAQKMSFEIQGHRGCRGLMPENTIPAFKNAIDLGVNTLELDVVISKDKQVVVSHDPFFNPDCTLDPNGNPVTKETSGNLYHLNYQEIKKYNVGAGNKNFPEQQKLATYKPLLEEMIQAAEAYAKSIGKPAPHYNIEIKSLENEYNKTQPEVPEFSDLVYQVIIKNLPPERVTLQSFDYNVLRFWHQKMSTGKYKKIALSVLIEPTHNNDVQANLKMLAFTPEIWSPYFLQMNETRVKELHTLGIRIIPWTVNERADMEKVKALGCDGLISDYPNRAIEFKE